MLAAAGLAILAGGIFALSELGGRQYAQDQPVQPVEAQPVEVEGEAGDDASADVARQLGHPSLAAACKASDHDQALAWTCGIDTVERSGIPVADGIVIRYKPLVDGENYGVKVWTGNPTSTAQFIASQGLPPGVRVVTVQRDSWGTAEVTQ